MLPDWNSRVQSSFQARNCFLYMLWDNGRHFYAQYNKRHFSQRCLLLQKWEIRRKWGAWQFKGVSSNPSNYRYAVWLNEVCTEVIAFIALCSDSLNDAVAQQYAVKLAHESRRARCQSLKSPTLFPEYFCCISDVKKMLRGNSLGKMHLYSTKHLFAHPHFSSHSNPRVKIAVSFWAPRIP